MTTIQLINFLESRAKLAKNIKNYLKIKNTINLLKLNKIYFQQLKKRY